MRVQANGIEIEVERQGEGEPLVLLMGIGAQLVLWPEPFCARLVELGFSVIRMDNRDVGLSSHLRHLPIPDPRKALLRAALGLKVDAPYTLSDMARDVVGVLDVLGVGKAHIVGASMGGMIAQTVAIEHRARVLSLTSVMSTAGDRRHVLATQPGALKALLGPLPRTREQAVQRMLNTFRAIGSRTHALDESVLRDMAERSYDRGQNPAGFARQMAAICAGGSRSNALSKLQLPTLVIHGSQDPLIPVIAGRAMARTIPNARLLELGDMGHDLPRPLWGTFANAIRSIADAS